MKYTEQKLDCSSAEFLTVNEGLCVQIMHLGSFDDEPATVEIMDKYIHENGYVNDIHSEYKPTGDQPQAIEALVKGFKEGNQFQTLLGVTGSDKTFTMANVIAALNKPTLIISHNKTLAGQLYGEMKEFFPNNAVEYFVSYYVHNSTPQYPVAYISFLN